MFGVSSIGDKLLEIMHREIVIHDKEGALRLYNQGDRNQVLLDIKRQVICRAWEQRYGIRSQEEGIAIGWGLHDDCGTNLTAGARTVFSNERLARLSIKLRRDDSRNGIWASCTVGNNNPHCARWIIFSPGVMAQDKRGQNYSGQRSDYSIKLHDSKAIPTEGVSLRAVQRGTKPM